MGLLTVGAVWLRLFFPPVGLSCPASLWELFALSYCILFCPIWLLFVGGLLSSEEEMEGQWIWGREEVGVEKGRERENCGQDITVWEKNLFSREKEKEKRKRGRKEGKREGNVVLRDEAALPVKINRLSVMRSLHYYKTAPPQNALKQRNVYNWNHCQLRFSVPLSQSILIIYCRCQSIKWGTTLTGTNNSVIPR